MYADLETLIDWYFTYCPHIKGWSDLTTKSSQNKLKKYVIYKINSLYKRKTRRNLGVVT
jgi:hypothetical protein